jgi:glycosyltransferase involved in cell wall biosynthesis
MITVNPKVSIVRLTYNHEEYIETAIDSILDQIIDFDVEFIIEDDFSNYSTSDIV